MVSLTRTVRFALGSAEQEGTNGYAGKPAMTGFGSHCELTIRCTGELDLNVGYLIDIQEIDRAVRDVVLPRLQRARDANSDPIDALRDAYPALAASLRKPLASLRLNLTPYYSLEIAVMPSSSSKPDKAENIAASAPALVRQRFDFAAAHRLHVAGLSDDENRRLFGKCNNANGHGHNYQVEPCVAVAPGVRFSLLLLEKLTKETILDRFDHKHLNLDTIEFGPGGVNPSVENIARVTFELLAPVIAAAGATLRDITVWETDRTSATYPG
ncbi:MAG: 6-carboxytetrahydropterin synthase [Phycisphaerales bacterium]|jgi:6-pyruvoyltetrahydropterin/6-carboxytetrahydropterin synthase